MSEELKPKELEATRLGVPIGMFKTDEPRYRIGPEEKVLQPYPVKRVIILGMGLSLWDFIHSTYGNPSHLGEEGTEIWSINYAGFVFNSHLIFNMHDFDAAEHKEVMQSYSKVPQSKVVSIRSYDWMQNSWEYPLQEVLEDVMCGVPYLKNTTSYALAFAILCRAQQIEIYGCDFDYDENMVNVGDKFERGRANLEFWIGKALAYNINVFVAPSGTLLGALDVTQKGNIEFYGYGKYQNKWDITSEAAKVSPIWKGFQQVPEFSEVEKAVEPG